MLDRFLQLIATLPTTALRIVITIGLMVATAVRYLIWGTPSGGDFGLWLAALSAWAVADVAQFTAKRITTSVDVIKANAAAVATGAPDAGLPP